MDAEHTVAAIKALRAATGAEDADELIEGIGIAFCRGYDAGQTGDEEDLAVFNLGLLAGLLGYFCGLEDTAHRVCDPDGALEAVLAQIAGEEGL